METILGLCIGVGLSAACGFLTLDIVSANVRAAFSGTSKVDLISNDKAFAFASINSWASSVVEAIVEALTNCVVTRAAKML